jgi:hypothetical protein
MSCRMLIALGGSSASKNQRRRMRSSEINVSGVTAISSSLYVGYGEKDGFYGCCCKTVNVKSRPIRKYKRDQSKKTKTYNRRDSQMVTHSSTSRPVQCLCMAERTGCPVLTDLWSYVPLIRDASNMLI